MISMVLMRNAMPGYGSPGGAPVVPLSSVSAPLLVPLPLPLLVLVLVASPVVGGLVVAPLLPLLLAPAQLPSCSQVFCKKSA
jgi:hypothetical protein